MKKKTVSLCLVLALLVTAAIGGTMAYFTDTDSDKNVMTTGNVNIEQIEVFDPETASMVPGIYNQKEVTVKNVGDSEAYIRTIFAFEDTWDASADVHYCVESAESGKVLTFPADVDAENWLQIKATNNTTGEWTVYTVGYYTYGDAKFAAGATTPVSLYDVGVAPTADNDWYAKVGDEYDVLVLSQAVQTAGFENADAAWAATFGALTEDSDVTVAEWFQTLLGEGYTVEAFDYSEYDWEQKPTFNAAATE